MTLADVVPDGVETDAEPGFWSRRFWREEQEEQSEPEDFKREEQSETEDFKWEEQSQQEDFKREEQSEQRTLNRKLRRYLMRITDCVQQCSPCPSCLKVKLQISASHLN